MIPRTPGELTQAVLAEASRTPDARLREILQALIRHLHGFATEVRLTEAEFQKAVQFIVALGQHTTDTHNEAVLLSGSLGFSTLITLLNNPPETQANLLGPFWRLHAPGMRSGETIVRSPTPGAALFAEIMVTNRDGVPIDAAEVDVWQSSASGLYENQDERQADMNLRGRFVTDGDGRFSFRSVMPASYPIPLDGPVGELIRAEGRDHHRPAHVHFLVHKPGYKVLVTQVYVADDPRIECDVQFGVTQPCIARFARHDEPRKGVDGSWYSLERTLVIERGETRLPRAPIR